MFKRTEARILGHLLDTLPEVAVGRVIATFGAPDEDGFVDEEAGYDGYDWHFQGRGGVVFHVYARSGVVRVGGTDNPEAFVTWFRAALE